MLPVNMSRSVLFSTPASSDHRRKIRANAVVVPSGPPLFDEAEAFRQQHSLDMSDQRETG